jgi:riboflavin synthase
MFSGIIEKQGSVLRVETTEKSLQLVIASGYIDLELGESIAVNGVCLTVAECTPAGNAQFYLSSETIAKSNLGTLTVGSLVNLERAVTLQTRLSGHLVQGHVDGTATLVAIVPEGETYDLRLSLSSALARYCVEKGSICLNGVSLTINSLTDTPRKDTLISARIIPHTWTHTNLSTLRVGQQLNVEVDIFAKYVERLCKG